MPGRFHISLHSNEREALAPRGAFLNAYGYQTFVPPSSTKTIIHPVEKKRRRRPRLLVSLCFLLAGVGLLHIIALTHPATMPMIWSTCTDLIQNYDYTKSIPPLRATQQMSAIQFVNELVGGEPAALIQVEDSKGQQGLDVYVFGCTMSKHTPTLTRLFQQRGLLQGSATITRANTLSIGEMDTRLDSDAYALLQPSQQDIFHEYRWVDGAFRAVRFPGIYPVMSRSEAEALQDEANNGQPLPWNDPVTTARELAQDIFRWPANEIQATLNDNNDVTAHVQLIRQKTRMNVSVTLMRLPASTQKAGAECWFVTDAHTEGMGGEQMDKGNSGSVIIHGRMQQRQAKERVFTELFDHTLSPMTEEKTNDGRDNALDVALRGDGSYTITISARDAGPGQPALFLMEGIPSGKSREPGELMLLGLRLPGSDNGQANNKE